MKRVLTNYIFDASLGTVTFTDFIRITYSDIYLVTNLTSGIVIFNPDTVPATVNENVLNLSYDTSLMNDDDILKIDFNYKQNYDGTNAVDGYDNVDIITSAISGEKGIRAFVGEYVADNGTRTLVTESKGHVCQDNTSTTPLGADVVFRGDWQSTLDYSEIIISLKTDQNSAVDGLAVYWSTNGVDIHGDDYFTVYANLGKTFSFPCQHSYVKLDYTNGPIAQGSFNIETILKRYASKGSSHRINDSIVGEDDAILTKAILSGRDDDGIFQNIESDRDNNLRVNAIPYTYSIAEELIANHTALLKFGTRTIVAANTQSLIWEGTNALYTYLTSAEQLKISSSSASDAVGGTGAITVNLMGLDADFNQIEEIVTMTGLAPVTTVLSFIRINRAFVETCGTALDNVGTITVTNNAATNQLLVIQPGDGQTLMSMWTVPAGKVAYLVAVTASTDSNKGARVSIRTKLNNGGILYPWLIKYRAYLFSGNTPFPFVIPFKIPAKTDIELNILTPTSAGDTSVGGTFELWYEDL